MPGEPETTNGDVDVGFMGSADVFWEDCPEDEDSAPGFEDRIRWAAVADDACADAAVEEVEMCAVAVSIDGEIAPVVVLDLA